MQKKFCRLLSANDRSIDRNRIELSRFRTGFVLLFCCLVTHSRYIEHKLQSKPIFEIQYILVKYLTILWLSLRARNLIHKSLENLL